MKDKVKQITRTEKSTFMFPEEEASFNNIVAEAKKINDDDERIIFFIDQREAGKHFFNHISIDDPMFSVQKILAKKFNPHCVSFEDAISNEIRTIELEKIKYGTYLGKARKLKAKKEITIHELFLDQIDGRKVLKKLDSLLSEQGYLINGKFQCQKIFTEDSKATPLGQLVALFMQMYECNKLLDLSKVKFQAKPIGMAFCNYYKVKSSKEYRSFLISGKTASNAFHKHGKKHFKGIVDKLVSDFSH